MKFTEPRPRLKTARVVRITDRRDRRARIERLLLLDESTVIGITNGPFNPAFENTEMPHHLRVK